jgi:arginine deiminase
VKRRNVSRISAVPHALQLRRRALLRSAGSAALASALPAHGSPSEGSRGPFVRADYARLRRVLVHAPSDEDLSIAAATQEVLGNSWPVLDPEAVAEHKAYVQALREGGAEVLLFEDLLADAVREAKRRLVWETWLSAAFPRLSGDPEAVDASSLLGRDPRYQFLKDASGAYRHVVDGPTSLCWARDFGVMLPAGLLIANSPSEFRRSESILFRFMTRFAPGLQEYPVVFDAAQEGLYLEGGDIAVLDERTLLVGTGNGTDPRAAPALARRVGMDVIAVQMREADFVKAGPDKSVLQTLFPHLDTCATLISPKHAIVVPWLLEARYAQDNPFIGFMRGLASNQGVDAEEAEQSIAYLQGMGSVRHYAASSGVEDETVKGLKLADWLRRRGFEALTVGGPPPPGPDYRHLVRVIFAELDRQAANVIATAPGQVIAFSGASATCAALKRSNIAVRVTDGRELRAGNGGPHCLAMPLERG